MKYILKMIILSLVLIDVNVYAQEYNNNLEVRYKFLKDSEFDNYFLEDKILIDIDDYKLEIINNENIEVEIVIFKPNDKILDWLEELKINNVVSSYYFKFYDKNKNEINPNLTFKIKKLSNFNNIILLNNDGKSVNKKPIFDVNNKVYLIFQNNIDEINNAPSTGDYIFISIFILIIAVFGIIFLLKRIKK